FTSSTPAVPRFFFFMLRPPPSSPLFPYTTLFRSDGRPLEAAPRHVFRRVLDRCHELGYEPTVGTEPEFYLLDRETRQPLFSGYQDRKSTRLNSSHVSISYAVFCLKKKNINTRTIH